MGRTTLERFSTQPLAVMHGSVKSSYGDVKLSQSELVVARGSRFTYGWSDGDMNGDGYVDSSDVINWQAHAYY